MLNEYTPEFAPEAEYFMWIPHEKPTVQSRWNCGNPNKELGIIFGVKIHGRVRSGGLFRFSWNIARYVVLFNHTTYRFSEVYISMVKFQIKVFWYLVIRDFSFLNFGFRDFSFFNFGFWDFVNSPSETCESELEKLLIWKSHNKITKYLMH